MNNLAQLQAFDIPDDELLCFVSVWGVRFIDTRSGASKMFEVPPFSFDQGQMAGSIVNMLLHIGFEVWEKPRTGIDIVIGASKKKERHNETEQP